VDLKGLVVAAESRQSDQRPWPSSSPR